MAIIRCPECREKVSDKADSCPHCGAPISRLVCIYCGAPISSRDVRCSKCGKTLGNAKNKGSALLDSASKKTISSAHPQDSPLEAIAFLPIVFICGWIIGGSVLVGIIAMILVGIVRFLLL